MATPGRSMIYSSLLFSVILSLLQMYKGKFASSELMTIVGGLICSLLFILMLTFIGNYQELSGMKTGWGAGNIFITKILVSSCFMNTLITFIFSLSFSLFFFFMQLYWQKLFLLLLLAQYTVSASRHGTSDLVRIFLFFFFCNVCCSVLRLKTKA
ncbi:Keratinocytes-associated protein 2 [Rhynchospora pubera]|uniref:Keratinocytes-associated protein 2 n=1 Tax=Rhynchospora pubera TaxID=906938 RepID=A0AAV8C6G0_9POAL|nr:Keratinocytes-associated protein 2 [Rhynchospora pubera]